jgi:hypothetical protein
LHPHYTNLIGNGLEAKKQREQFATGSAETAVDDAVFDANWRSRVGERFTNVGNYLGIPGDDTMDLPCREAFRITRHPLPWRPMAAWNQFKRV